MREIPRDVICLIIRSCGGECSWDKTVGPGATYTEDDVKIDYQVVDRPMGEFKMSRLVSFPGKKSCLLPNEKLNNNRNIIWLVARLTFRQSFFYLPLFNQLLSSSYIWTWACKGKQFRLTGYHFIQRCCWSCPLGWVEIVSLHFLSIKCRQSFPYPAVLLHLAIITQWSAV